MKKLFSLAILSLSLLLSTYGFEFKYHNYDDITSMMTNFSRSHPNTTYLYSIGKSVQGRELWVLALSKSQPSLHVPLRPEAKYIGAMHGNEVPAKEILLSLIDHLLTMQGVDPDVDYLLANTRIHVMPSMNPDGFEAAIEGECDGDGRYNANGYDLNRNFPDLFQTNEDPLQVETKAVMSWLEREDFVLSANFHGGALLVNYPYDNYKDADENSLESNYSATSDDDVFRSMALNYSLNHLQMSKPESAPCSNEFENGITNGADWYPIKGGMQDYNYWKHGCMELTMEVSCCKYPPSDELWGFWSLNKKPLIEYLKLANTGVRGIVSFESGIPAVNATIKIDSREPFFKTNKNGEFYRILLPGKYNLSVALDCADVYRTVIEISPIKRLLEFNITLNSSILSKYKNLKLNKYAVFCPSVSSHKSGALSLHTKLHYIHFLLILFVFV